MRSGNIVSGLMYRGCFGRCSLNIDGRLEEASRKLAELDTANDKDVNHTHVLVDVVGVLEGGRFAASGSKVPSSRWVAMVRLAQQSMAWSGCLTTA